MRYLSEIECAAGSGGEAPETILKRAKIEGSSTPVPGMVIVSAGQLTAMARGVPYALPMQGGGLAIIACPEPIDITVEIKDSFGVPGTKLELQATGSAGVPVYRECIVRPIKSGIPQHPGN